MHHPGPPRFLATGETTTLAPRDPDPAGTYEWRVVDAPPGSEATVGQTPVTTFTPDVPGRFTIGLRAPDGDHHLTIRAFDTAYEGVDVAGGSGTAIRDRDADNVPVEYGSEAAHEGTGPPRIRLDAVIKGASETDRASGTARSTDPNSDSEQSIVVTASATPNPKSVLDASDLTVEFVIDDRDVAAAVAAGRTNPRDVLEIGDINDHSGSAPSSRSETISRLQTSSKGDTAGSRSDTTGSRSDTTGSAGVSATLRVPTSAIQDQLRVHAVTIADEPGQERRFSVADAVAVERVEDDGDPRGPTTPIPDRFETVRLNEPPAWTRDARVYEVYVRTFADDDAGEPLTAIADRIPELAELGVDTLWLTPVLGHDGMPHGYNIVDFFDVADDLGERGDYEALIETAHDHGLRVLFDFVANHTARDHDWFQDAYNNPDSPYRDRYEWQESGEPGTYFDWELIANLNHENLHVRRFLLDVIDKWAPLVDGFRCDMAWAVPNDFWRELRDRVKAMDREFLLMDETIPYIADFHEGMFDVHFDATLYFQLRQVGRGVAPAHSVLDAIDQRAAVGFPDDAGFLQYIENHDETRYRVECGDAAAAAAGAATVTLPGMPMVYAGQEIGQQGRRDAIAWDHARTDIRDRYERLLETHAEHHEALGPAGDLSRVDYHVASGDLVERPIEADGETVHPNDVVAFIRSGKTESFVVVLNFAPEAAAVDVDVPHGSQDVVSGESCVVTDGDGVDRIHTSDVAIVPLEDAA